MTLIAGFQLNTDVLSIVILRYMRKDGTLRFGDFVSAILHLNDAFGELLNTFRKLFAEWRFLLKTNNLCLQQYSKVRTRYKMELLS